MLIHKPFFNTTFDMLTQPFTIPLPARYQIDRPARCGPNRTVEVHRCDRNKMKQFAAFRCKMRQTSTEQDEANRSRLKRFAGVCRRPEEIMRQRWLLHDGPDWCWLTPERFLCIPVW